MRGIVAVRVEVGEWSEADLDLPRWVAELGAGENQDLLRREEREPPCELRGVVADLHIVEDVRVAALERPRRRHAGAVRVVMEHVPALVAVVPRLQAALVLHSISVQRRAMTAYHCRNADWLDG